MVAATTFRTTSPGSPCTFRPRCWFAESIVHAEDFLPPDVVALDTGKFLIRRDRSVSVLPSRHAPLSGTGTSAATARLSPDLRWRIGAYV